MLIFNFMNKHKQQTGAAMVELALLLPLLFILLFGITEMGRALYQQSILIKTVGNATRMLSRSFETIDVENDCATTANWTAAQADATNLLIYGDVDGGASPILAGLNVIDITVENRNLENFSKTVCIVKISAQAPFVPVVSDALFGFPNFNLKASSEQRYIGE